MSDTRKKTTYVRRKDFRLFDFHIYDGVPTNNETDDSSSGSDDGKFKKNKYINKEVFIIV